MTSGRPGQADAGGSATSYGSEGSGAAAASLGWRTIPLFVSSTFRDMHAERDYLQRWVFPELEERLRVRRCRLEVVDLRWGVETVSINHPDEKELQVLNVCLTELRRCLPFVVVLLGDRYGWVPPPERIAVIAAAAGLSTEVAGKSVTALEVELGVLASPPGARGCWVYLREPLPYDRMSAATAAVYREVHAEGGEESVESHSPRARLEALKAACRRELPGRVRRYRTDWDGARETVTGLERWGRQVLEDLWSDLAALTAGREAAGEPTWQAQERWARDEFLERSGAGFVGREEEVARAVRFATGAAAELWGLGFMGEAGSGKSALAAQIHRKLQSHSPEEFLVLSHAAGVTHRSRQLEPLLERWSEELRQSLGIPAAAREVEERNQTRIFQELLRRVARTRRVVLLLDAVDELESLTNPGAAPWLPERGTENVRVLFTSQPGAAVVPLLALPGIDIVEVGALAPEAAGQLIQDRCRRHGKRLHAEVEARILAHRVSNGLSSYGSPLWLTLVVEELLTLDAADFAQTARYGGTGEENLHRLLLELAEALPPDVAGVYARLLERQEEAYGLGWAQAFASLLAVSRDGLRERDLRCALPALAGEVWEGARCAATRRGYREHLHQSGALGQWQFAHAQLREAIERRYLQHAPYKRRTHAALADHLLALPVEDRLRITETMYHLVGADDRLRAAEYYGETPLRLHLELPPHYLEAINAATEVLAEHVLAGETLEPNPHLEWVSSLLEQDTEGTGHANLYDLIGTNLVQALGTRTRISTRLRLARLGKPMQATTVRLFSGWLNDNRDPWISRLPLRMGRLLRRINPIYSWRRNSLHNLALGYANTADLLADAGRPAEALSEHREALRIRRRLSLEAPEDHDLALGFMVSLRDVADVLSTQESYDEALGLYREAVQLTERCMVGGCSESWLTLQAQSWDDIGGILSKRDDALGAENAHSQATLVRERLRRDHPESQHTEFADAIECDAAGERCVEAGDYAVALSRFSEGLAIRKKAVEREPEEPLHRQLLAVSYGNVGNVLRELGDTAGAFAAYRAALDQAEALVASDPKRLLWQQSLWSAYWNLASLKQELGYLDGAIDDLRSALVASEHVAATGDALWIALCAEHYDELGSLLLRLERYADAVEAFRHTLELSDRLTGRGSEWEDPGRGASAAKLMGHCYLELADADAAVKAFELARERYLALAAQAVGAEHWDEELQSVEEGIRSVEINRIGGRTDSDPAIVAEEAYPRAKSGSGGKLAELETSRPSAPKVTDPPETLVASSQACGGSPVEYETARSAVVATPLLGARRTAALHRVVGDLPSHGETERISQTLLKTVLPDGTVVVREAKNARALRLGCATTLMVIFALLVPVIVAACALAAVAFWRAFGRDTSQLLAAGPARIILWTFGVVMWAAMATLLHLLIFCPQEWWMKSNSLEIHRVIFGMRLRQRFSNAMLRLQTKDGETKLLVDAGGRASEIRLFSSEGVFVLASVLAKHTGWSLREE